MHFQPLGWGRRHLLFKTSPHYVGATGVEPVYRHLIRVLLSPFSYAPRLGLVA